MKRCLFEAQYKMNPQSRGLEKMDVPEGTTLPDPTWDTPRMEREGGSVKNGVAFTEPMYNDQPKYSTEKRN